MNELNLTVNKELREQVAGRVEVLDKVKKLFLLPQLEMMTQQQVADYYGVEFDSIRKCYTRNKEEICADGAAKMSAKSIVSLLGHNVTSEYVGHCYQLHLSNDVVLRIPNAGILLFPKRAILRIGMLLRDSEIAKEVRTQLLNVFENSTDEGKTEELDAEMEMYSDLGKAFVTGSKEDMMLKMQEIVQYHRRHIDALTAENKTIKDDNKMLAANILAWSDRKSVNKAIRVIAGMANKQTAYVWAKLYEELRYKHGIGLSQRGKKPYLQHVREDEWPLVQQSLSAICEEYGISPSYIFNRAKIGTSCGKA